MSQYFGCLYIRMQVLFELVSFANSFENADKFSVLASILEHVELGGPKLRFFESNFIFLHVRIHLLFVSNHACVG